MHTGHVACLHPSYLYRVLAFRLPPKPILASKVLLHCLALVYVGTNPPATNAKPPSGNERRTKIEEDEQNFSATNPLAAEWPVCWFLFNSTTQTHIHEGTHTQHNPRRTLTSTGRIPRSRCRLHLPLVPPLRLATYCHRGAATDRRTTSVHSGAFYTRTHTQPQLHARTD